MPHVRLPRVFAHTIPLPGTLIQLDIHTAQLSHPIQISAQMSCSPVTSYLKFKLNLLALLHFFFFSIALITV